MKKIMTSIFVLLFFMTSFAFAADKKPANRLENYLAIMDVEVSGKVDKDIVRGLTDSIRTEIVKSGKYEVMERGNMDKILKEQAFQMTGCTTKECAVEAGQLLGVGKIVVGSVGLVGKTYILSLSLVNVESGKIEKVEDQECKCEIDDLLQLSRNVAGKLMGVAVAMAPPAKPEMKEQFCRQTDGRFCDRGDGTVSDKTTGLLWQQRDDGAERNWDNAVAYCRDLMLTGKANWRLPSKEEFSSLTPAIYKAYFLDTKKGYTASNYWSSTTDAHDIMKAWVLSLLSGNSFTNYKVTPYYTFCVR